MVIVCILTGAICLYLVDKYDTTSTILALIKLQATYGPIKHMSADSGTQLLADNVDLKVVGKVGGKLFNFLTTYRAPPRCQF